MAEEPDGNSEADRVRLGSHTTCLFPRRPQTLHPVNSIPVTLSSVSPEEIETGIMPDIVTQGFGDIMCLFLENPG